MNSKIDLHMHSERSDGSDTVPELLQKIKTLDMQGITQITELKLIIAMLTRKPH